MNGKTNVANVAVITPNMASWVLKVNSIIRVGGIPAWLSLPGR